MEEGIELMSTNNSKLHIQKDDGEWVPIKSCGKIKGSCEYGRFIKVVILNKVSHEAKVYKFSDSEWQNQGGE